MSDINHPSHYNKENSKECIVEQREKFGVIAVLLFCVLNTYKYHYRQGLKESEDKDKRKAHWYMEYTYNLIVKYWWLRILLYIMFHEVYKYILKFNKVNG